MKRALAEIARQPATCVAVLLIAAVVFAAIAAPWLAPFSPDAQPFDGLSMEGAPLPPGSKYWLGTDTLGRDLLSRLLFGARTSLVIGLVANGVAVLIGMIVGVVAGYVERVCRQCADALHRSDDGLPGASARDRAGGAAPDPACGSSRW